MKTLVLFTVLLLFSFSGYTQEITQLEEARINLEPIIPAQTSNPDEYRFEVNQGFAVDFIKNPLQFVKDYFDIHGFIASVSYKNYDSYQVRFSTRKGYLEVDYSKDGELTKSVQKFKDIFLPLDVRNELFRQTKGWSMVKNTYSARGNGDVMEKEEYRIKVKNGNKSRIVKIDPRKIKESQMVSQ